MERIWQRLEAWLQQHALDVYLTLESGATAEELQQVEETLNITLPKDVSDFYGIHNGQQTDKYGLTATKFLYGWEVPNLKRVAQLWNDWKKVLEKGHFVGIHSQPDEGVLNDWWNVGWIPILQNSDGDHLCLDLSPGKGGQVGQIISVWHDAPERTLYGNSFREWVGTFADGLENGAYVYSHGYGGIIEANQARYYE